MPSAVKAILIIVALMSGSAAEAQERRREGLGWQKFSIPQSGLRVDYPAAIFSVEEGEAKKGVGQSFSSSDGRSRLMIYSQPNEAGLTPRSYLRKNLRVSRSILSYQRVAPSFFAISTHQRGEIYYSRCNFSDRSGAIHCIDLVYPEAEERAWDGIVTRISLSLRPLEG